MVRWHELHRPKHRRSGAWLHLGVQGESAVVEAPSTTCTSPQAGGGDPSRLVCRLEVSSSRSRTAVPAEGKRRAPDVVVDIDGRRRRPTPTPPRFFRQPMVRGGGLRKVGWNSVVGHQAFVELAGRTPGTGSFRGGLNNDKLPTCMGCSRDSVNRNIESVGGHQFHAPPLHSCPANGLAPPFFPPPDASGQQRRRRPPCRKLQRPGSAGEHRGRGWSAFPRRTVGPWPRVGTSR